MRRETGLHNRKDSVMDPLLYATLACQYWREAACGHHDGCGRGCLAAAALAYAMLAISKVFPG